MKTVEEQTKSRVEESEVTNKTDLQGILTLQDEEVKEAWKHPKSTHRTDYIPNAICISRSNSEEKQLIANLRV